MTLRRFWKNVEVLLSKFTLPDVDKDFLNAAVGKNLFFLSSSSSSSPSSSSFFFLLLPFSSISYCY
jgi:hypothetical protein